MRSYSLDLLSAQTVARSVSPDVGAFRRLLRSARLKYTKYSGARVTRTQQKSLDLSRTVLVPACVVCIVWIRPTMLTSFTVENPFSGFP